ncbi:MAG TPA: CidA/LrgA family protein [Desulfobacteria bacterium]|nr:CidA/LrgA family protein [Desulfobacteria bacterium]
MTKNKMSEKKGVKILEGFAIILFTQSLGTFLSNRFDLILPGNLTGLLLLFLALLFKIVKLETVEGAANLLLDNMMVLFIPLNVGLMTILPRLKQEWLAILVSILASTIIVMVVTAKTVEFAEGRRKSVKLPS